MHLANLNFLGALGWLSMDVLSMNNKRSDPKALSHKDKNYLRMMTMVRRRGSITESGKETARAGRPVIDSGDLVQRAASDCKSRLVLNSAMRTGSVPNFLKVRGRVCSWGFGGVGACGEGACGSAHG